MILIFPSSNLEDTDPVDLDETLTNLNGHHP